MSVAAQILPYDLQVSKSADRSSAAPLEGATVEGPIYVFVPPAAEIREVRFYLDDAGRVGAPRQIEQRPPWDFAGTTTTGTARPFNTTGVVDGSHVITAVVLVSDGSTTVQNATFTVSNGSARQLKVSMSPDRSSSVPLDGAKLRGNVYIFVPATPGITGVRFYLDDPGGTGTPRQVEGQAPWDFAGTAVDGTAKPFNVDLLAGSTHTATAAIALSNGTTLLSSGTFTIGGLSFTPASASFSLGASETGSSETVLAGAGGAAATFSLSESASWLAVSPATGTTPATITISVDASGLSPGTYTAAVDATSAAHGTATFNVTLTVGGAAECSPLLCSEILVQPPYQLSFGSDHGKIRDGADVGTGFTYVAPPKSGSGYLPGNLSMQTSTGVLRVTTTKGLFQTSANSQDNALGVGIDAPSQVTRLGATLVNPPSGTGNYEQAGLWFGNDQDNYVKLVVISTPTGTKVETLMERTGATAGSRSSAALNLTAARVVLSLRADPVTRSIAASYQINGGASQSLGSFTAAPEFFSFDAAGIDPRIGTRSFGGILASHRNGPAPVVYSFDDFSMTKEVSAPPPPPSGSGGTSFISSSFALNRPTSMAWGPDGRLYVTELMGRLHAVTLGTNKQPVADQVISTLGQRLTLGITVDPLSTPSNVILWVSHSSPSLNDGTPNSSTVTRLSGSAFTTRQDVITGLPRAKANHAINSIHFGPDGRLYIAQGGNTGAGAPNTANTEFGTMEEQPLSAAILVADVHSATFDGSCHNPNDIFGPPPCDVVPYATGLRNAYDFVFHSNGSMYAPDNGLGVTGTFPPSPAPPCFGYGDPALWTQGGDNPGEQPDTLLRIEQGKYYGHPNPYRNECVFGDGHFQGVSARPTYQAPIHNFGMNRSTNGTIEYTSNAFCGELKGNLLFANYSVGDDITSVKLSANGTSVVSATQLRGGFDDPLPLTLGPDGTIYVGEYGGSRITALQPVDSGCWSTKKSMPQSVLDAGGAALNGRMYVVAGKTSGGHQTTMYIYDPTNDTWSLGPAVPGPPVENPAVVPYNGKLYVFGGSTAPFSGAVTNASVFDPSAGSWAALPPMAVARGGAAAQVLGGKIYVAGGMADDGASLASVDVFDPASRTWSSAPSMATRRDNPGSAVLDGNLYVFGGRIREANGSTVNGALTSVERFDPVAATWTARAPMPTGRRAVVVGTIGGRAQVMGGEGGGSAAFVQNEEYDPATDSWRTLRAMLTGRHGAAAATMGGVVYVAGGGPNSGSSFTGVLEAFSFQ